MAACRLVGDPSTLELVGRGDVIQHVGKVTSPDTASKSRRTPRSHRGIVRRDRCRHRYGQCPEPVPERRQHHPAARLRRLPGPAGGHRPDHRAGLRGRLPAHRHRARCTATRRASARRSATPGSRATSCSSPASSTTASTSPTTARAAFDQTLADLGLDQVDLFLIHWPLPTQYDGDFVSTWKTLIEFQERRPRPLDRRLQLPARPPGAAGRGDRRGAGGEPDRGAPLLRQRGRALGQRAPASSPRRGRRSPRAACSTTT